MKLKIALLGSVAALSLIAVRESSARHEGWYVGLEGGANWVDDTEFRFDFDDTPPLNAPDFAGDADFDTGWAALGTVGYAFDSHWRVELELGYRQNDMGAFSFIDGFDNEEDPIIRTFSGELTEYTAMVNVIYDVPLSDRLDLNLGLGAGADYSQFEDSGIVDDEDVTFAYQAIAGVTYALTDRLDLAVTYRYLNAGDPEFSSTALRRTDTYQFDDVEKHTVTVGLRYDLYEDEKPVVSAPPAPLPAPVNEAARQFIVFFGFNKANLTPEAMSVIKEAAAAAKSEGSASIIVVGHTDTVGSNKYNDALALRRSSAVKAGLVGEGISATSIMTSGKGESSLLVKTDDNVREPQNRRATIDLN
jgi:OmpA-OmpF porin, OOP family